MFIAGCMWDRRRITGTRFAAWAILAATLAGLLAANAIAQESNRGVEDDDDVEMEERDTGRGAPRDDKTPELPDIGVRFTPQMAQAISKQMTRQMKRRYELDDAQVESIQAIMERQLIKVVARNAEAGRDLIEKMMATMIENDGRFPKETAQEFAKDIKPLLPAIKDFFKESSAEVSKQMTVKQRMKLTGDMAGVTAGFAIFENRMKRWEEGKVGDNANPFFDSADRDPDKVEEPADPNENPEYGRARRNVERWIEWQVEIDRNWEQYVTRAIEYYELNEEQANSARAILKECQERAKAIKTDDWRKRLKDNRITQQLSWGLKGDYGVGPWQNKLESEYERLLKPLKDLDAQFKKRIDALADSNQRAKADGVVRKQLSEKGVKNIPV